MTAHVPARAWLRLRPRPRVRALLVLGVSTAALWWGATRPVVDASANLTMFFSMCGFIGYAAEVLARVGLGTLQRPRPASCATPVLLAFELAAVAALAAVGMFLLALLMLVAAVLRVKCAVDAASAWQRVVAHTKDKFNNRSEIDDVTHYPPAN